MSDQHEVTVYDRVAVTGRVSVGQFGHYLARNGWEVALIDDTPACGEETLWSAWMRPDVGFAAYLWPDMPARTVADRICAIADVEGRQPSAVLADIAKEPA